MEDIKIEILDDGRVKVTTGDMAGANHASADQFLDLLSKLLGGDVEKKKAKRGHTHSHSHDHAKQG